MWHIIDYGKSGNISLLCFFADAEKAFDRLEWDLSKEMVYKMKLEDKSAVGLDSVYREQYVIIKMNDLNSEPVVWQEESDMGPHCSCCYFILV